MEHAFFIMKKWKVGAEIQSVSFHNLSQLLLGSNAVKSVLVIKKKNKDA